MHGPSGSGKSTAAHAAAAALGLHVVPYSCHEFNGQADQVAASALRAAFQGARSFAPAVLLLQDFAALSDGNAPGRSHGPCHMPNLVLYQVSLLNMHWTVMGFADMQFDSHAGGMQAPMLRLATVLSDCIEQCCKPAQSTVQNQEQVNGTQLVILVACANSVEDVAAPLRRCFTHEIGLEAVDQDARLHLLQVKCPNVALVHNLLGSPLKHACQSDSCVMLLVIVLFTGEHAQRELTRSRRHAEDCGSPDSRNAAS